MQVLFLGGRSMIMSHTTDQVDQVSSNTKLAIGSLMNIRQKAAPLENAVRPMHKMRFYALRPA